jgi:hypothetical protein
MYPEDGNSGTTALPKHLVPAHPKHLNNRKSMYSLIQEE